MYTHDGPVAHSLQEGMLDLMKTKDTSLRTVFDFEELIVKKENIFLQRFIITQKTPSWILVIKYIHVYIESMFS